MPQILANCTYEFEIHMSQILAYSLSTRLLMKPLKLSTHECGQDCSLCHIYSLEKLVKLYHKIISFKIVFLKSKLINYICAWKVIHIAIQKSDVIGKHEEIKMILKFCNGYGYCNYFFLPLTLVFLVWLSCSFNILFKTKLSIIFHLYGCPDVLF